MSRLEELSIRTDAELRSVRDALSRLDGKVELAERFMAESRALTLDADVTQKARLMLESYSEEEQAKLLGRVEALVSRGLQVIFGEGYGFSIEVGESRGQVTTEFRVTVGEAGRDPLESHGGGLVNIVAFVLRLVVVALTPGLSRTVVLDEPFAQLSGGYLEAVGSFLRELVDATGIQLLLVSHEPEIAAVADVAWRMKRQDGKLRVVAL